LVNRSDDRPALRSHGRRFETLLAIRCQNSPSNGRSGPGIAVVFLERGLSPIPMQMASTKPNRGPYRGVRQFRCRTQGLIKINQTQFVAESRIFGIVRHQAIEISPGDNYQKITMTTGKTNKLTNPEVSEMSHSPAEQEILITGLWHVWA
jgi:hypothetical protein